MTVICSAVRGKGRLGKFGWKLGDGPKEDRNVGVCSLAGRNLLWGFEPERAQIGAEAEAWPGSASMRISTLSGWQA